jgi:hypothetical protein
VDHGQQQEHGQAQNLAGRFYGSPAQSQKKSAGLQPAPLLVELIQTLIIKAQVRVHAVRENAVLQRAGMQPGATWDFVQELRRYALESKVDQVIDAGIS